MHSSIRVSLGEEWSIAPLFLADAITRGNIPKQYMKKSRSQAWKEWERSAWQEVLEAIRAFEPERRVRLLDALLTDHEKALIAKRLAALALMREGKTYRAIGAALRMSPSTIRMLKKITATRGTYHSNRHYSAIRSAAKARPIRATLPPSPTALDYLLSFPKKIGKGRWQFLDVP
jgi:uncharacterized protein YerC